MEKINTNLPQVICFMLSWYTLLLLELIEVEKINANLPQDVCSRLFWYSYFVFELTFG